MCCDKSVVGVGRDPIQHDEVSVVDGRVDVDGETEGLHAC